MAQVGGERCEAERGEQRIFDRPEEGARGFGEGRQDHLYPHRLEPPGLFMLDQRRSPPRGYRLRRRASLISRVPLASKAFDQGEPLTNDQSVVGDVALVPEPFVRRAPLLDGFEAFALVARELEVDVRGSNHLQLGRLDHSQRLVVVPEQTKTLAEFWQRLVRMGYVFFAQAGGRDLVSTKYRRGELTAQLGAAMAHLHRPHEKLAAGHKQGDRCRYRPRNQDEDGPDPPPSPRSKRHHSQHGPGNEVTASAYRIGHRDSSVDGASQHVNDAEDPK